MTMNKDLIIDELKDEIENLAYENKRMGDFIQLLGLAPDRYIIAIVRADIPIPNTNASLSVVLASGALYGDSEAFSLAPG